MRVQVATTDGFKALEKDSRGRNQGPNKELMDKLDPDGVHVAAFRFVHNEVELRVRWLVKVKGEAKPVEVYMDNGFEMIDEHTIEKEAPDG